MSEKKERVTVIEDANIVAFLTLKGCIAIPYIQTETKEGGESARVCWDVEGDISEEVKKYYGNEKVGVYTFVRMLKDVRSQMYNCKSMSGNLKRTS